MNFYKLAQQMQKSAPPPMLTPSQQIMQKIIMEQQRQAMLKQQAMQMAMQPKQPRAADILKMQHEQQDAQESAVENQIKTQQKQMLFSQLMPKETVQSSDNTTFMEPQRIQQLEQLYMQNYGTIPPSPQFIRDVREAYTGLPLKNYPGGFPDMSLTRSQQRPLGDESSALTTF